MATKRTYHVIVPATGEAIEYTTTGKEYAFAAIVNFPREEGTYWSGEKWVREGGWGIVKKSATEKGASAVGQTKRHAEHLKSFPWAVVPIIAGPAPVAEEAPAVITEVPIGADVRLAEADEDEAARGFIFEVKSDSKYDADPLVAVHWEDDRVTVEYFEDLTVLPTFYSYNRVLEIAGEKDADGWRHATITLREGDTAADPGSTKKGFAGKGTIEYHIHPSGLHYAPSEGVYSIYLR